MSLDKYNDILSQLDHKLEFKNEEDKLQLSAELIHLRFISLIEKMMDESGINYSDLAELLKTSKSYISQLFAGDKLINMKTMAKLQVIFDCRFDFKEIPAQAQAPFEAKKNNEELINGFKNYRIHKEESNSDIDFIIPSFDDTTYLAG